MVGLDLTGLCLVLTGLGLVLVGEALFLGGLCWRGMLRFPERVVKVSCCSTFGLVGVSTLAADLDLLLSFWRMSGFPPLLIFRFFRLIKSEIIK